MQRTFQRKMAQAVQRAGYADLRKEIVTNKKDETIQRDIFIAQEGNKFFDRNKQGLTNPSRIKSLVAQRIAHHLAAESGSRVLEIGCSSGGNLAELNQLSSIECYGVDPSSDAIRAGKRLFPDFNLQVGSADSLPFGDQSMDVVWFGFCLYLVDRALLHRVICEADRVVKDGGFIAIHDFDPDVPSVRPYRHFQGLNSYKMDYSALFLSDPAYSLAEKVAFAHDDVNWTSDPQERMALCICRKNLRQAYKGI